MRTFVLASAATALAALAAAPAFADDSATVDFTFFVDEACEFDTVDTTIPLAFDADAEIAATTIEIDIDCNTPFNMVAEDGVAGGTLNRVSMARIENRSTVVAEYAKSFTGVVGVDMGDATGLNGAGRYPSQDAIFTYTIDWTGGGGTGVQTGGYAAGNYTGAVVFTLTGRDVTNRNPAAPVAPPTNGGDNSSANG